jgi:hypothetical protein
VGGELGGGGAVVPETGQEHRDAAAADSAAQSLAVDPQVLSHAGARVTARVAVQGAQHVIGVLRVAGVAEDPGEGRGVRAAGVTCGVAGRAEPVQDPGQGRRGPRRGALRAAVPGRDRDRDQGNPGGANPALQMTSGNPHALTRPQTLQAPYVLS